MRVGEAHPTRRLDKREEAAWPLLSISVTKLQKQPRTAGVVLGRTAHAQAGNLYIIIF